MSTHIPTIAIDFDGVIHSYTSGWKGTREIPDPPVPGALKFLYNLTAHTPTVARPVIYSTRAAEPHGRNAIKDWLRLHGGQAAWGKTVTHLGLESVRITALKPPAVVYIDDRGFRFEGTFPSIESLLEMEPWNKKS